MKIPRKNNIVRLLNSPGYRPLRSKEILKKLNVPKESRNLLKKLLKKMLDEKLIRRIDGGRYVLFDETKNGKPKQSSEQQTSYLLGKIIKKGKNYIFLPREEKYPDIYLDPNVCTNIKNNTLVLLRLFKNSKQIKIDQIIGRAGNIETERKAILLEFRLQTKFPKRVSKEAESMSISISGNEAVSRKDLRDKTIFTIDGDSAKDFDDAVGINKIKNGYKVWVSIADVSTYVESNSSLDKEALKRGNSFYFPDMVVPMLPEVLSNNLCSLVPNEDRLTKTVEINYNKNGFLTNYKIYNSVIKSCARLTYSKVSGVLNNSIQDKIDDKKIVKSLKIMEELYKKLKKIRVDNGELDFDFPEPEIIRDREGNVVNIVKSERNIAHGIIEEFMISANSVVGNFLKKSNKPSLYRIHEPPNMLSMYELKESLTELGYDIDFNGSEVRPKNIQKVIFEAKKKKNKSAVNTLVLKSLNKAEYSTKDIEHFGLAIDNYTHFTSPIRRYPDLVAHRLVNSLIEGSEIEYNRSQIDKIAQHCSKKERLADEAERESIDLERAFFMKSRVGEIHTGTVISILPFGMFLELEEIFVEGFVSKFNMKKGRKKRWFQLGQKVRVKVIESDVEKRRITLDLA